MIEIPGWTLIDCTTCDGRTYVEDADTEPARCHQCRMNEEKTMAKAKKAKKANGKASLRVGGSDHDKLLADGGVERKRYTEELPVPVSPEEYASASVEFAAAYREREEALEERREAMAGFRETLTGIEKRMKKLAETIEKHTKLAPVECGRILCRTGEAYREREKALEERREAMAGFRETLTGIDERMKKLAETIEKHTKLAPIECVEVLTAQNEIRVVRTDTGEEVEVRTASSEEFQSDMFPEGLADHGKAARERAEGQEEAPK